MKKYRCSTQKSCGYTWGLYLVIMMVGDISQFTICVARFLISHVRFYPPFTLLLDVTLPLLFSELGKKSVYKILKTSPEELPDLISLTNADLETTINAARHAVSLLYDPKGKLKSCHHDRSMRVKLATSKRRFPFSYST
jgi:hypothetical protein